MRTSPHCGQDRGYPPSGKRGGILGQTANYASHFSGHYSDRFSGHSSGDFSKHFPRRLIKLRNSCNILIHIYFFTVPSWPTRSRLININQGDTIHHPHHGIGKVQSIGKRSFHGEKESTFAQLYFKRQDLTLMVRKEDLEGTVRNPIDAKEAAKLLAHLRQWKGKVSTQWKARANAHHAALDRGDPFECAEVYKGLKILDSEGGLRASDRAHLNQSLDFLTEEVANALGQSRDKTREQIVGM